MSRRLGDYVPLSVAYANDGSILELSPMAELLFVRGLALAGQLSSDGYLTEAQVVHRAGPKLGSEKKVLALAAELVRSGVWQRADGGYLIRAWLKWNKSADALGRDRARDRDRKRAERSGTADENAPDSSESPPRVQPDTSRTPAGIQADDTGSPNGHQPDSSRSPASRTRAYTPAPSPVVTKSLSGTAQNCSARDEPPPPPNPRPAANDNAPGAGKAGEGDDLASLVAEIREIRPGWATGSIRRALDDSLASGRPLALVRPVALTLARDPETQQPGRLPKDGPWWHMPPSPPAPEPPRPPCTTCSGRRRCENPDGSDAGPCPDCHPDPKRRKEGS